MILVSAKMVKTRKAHRCIGCGRKFPSGTVLQALVWTDLGIWSDYWCEVCTEYFGQHCQPDDLFDESGLRGNDPEGWEEVRVEIESSSSKEEAKEEDCTPEEQRQCTKQVLAEEG